MVNPNITPSNGPTPTIVTSPPVSVIPKTKEQQVRSAWYTLIAGLGLVLPAICDFIGKIEPQLKALFPKEAEIIGPICQIASGIGILLLASQRKNSAETEQSVNLSVPVIPSGGPDV